MIVYGLTQVQAFKHLGTIRASLGKTKRRQLLHIAEFCKAENIQQSDFESIYLNEVNKTRKHTTTPQ